MKKIIEGLSVFFVGAISVGYLLNPGMGWIELIPDNFPIVGNLDEAVATTLLLGAFAYFGIDLTRIFKSARGKERTKETAALPPVIDTDVETTQVGGGRRA